jgi:hypothetical protein
VRPGAGSDAGKFYFTFNNIDGTSGLQDLNANNINTITVEVRKDSKAPVVFNNAIKDEANNGVVTGTVVNAK